VHARWTGVSKWGRGNHVFPQRGQLQGAVCWGDVRGHSGELSRPDRIVDVRQRCLSDIQVAFMWADRSGLDVNRHIWRRRWVRSCQRRRLEAPQTSLSLDAFLFRFCIGRRPSQRIVVKIPWHVHGSVYAIRSHQCLGSILMEWLNGRGSAGVVWR